MSELELSKDGFPSPDPNILFDAEILESLDYSKCSCYTKHGVSYSDPGSRDGRKLIARPLEREDISKGYLHLLSQLTQVGDYGREVFEAQFDRMKAMPGSHYILVLEDPGTLNGMQSGRIVASATLIVECKFVHGAAMRGRLEDLVVDSNYRGMHLGTFLLETLSMCSQVLHCYKLTLDCKEVLSPYYSKVGFKNEGQCFLTQRFFD
jgi:glucosamine-phosphate N-acetyltransferase